MKKKITFLWFTRIFSILVIIGIPILIWANSNSIQEENYPIKVLLIISSFIAISLYSIILKWSLSYRIGKEAQDERGKDTGKGLLDSEHN